MRTSIFKVVSQGVVTYIPSPKEESGQLAKCVIRLKEFGGKYGDEYACTMFGNLSLCRFAEGDEFTFKPSEEIIQTSNQQNQKRR